MSKKYKCAPSKIYENGSCFTLEDLIKITENYNKNNNDKIKIINDKKILLKELIPKMKNKYHCDNQICWLDIINDNEIKKNTFRPEGPDNQYEWLSTSDINNVMKQYEYKYNNFKFLGAIPNDFEDLPYYGIGNINFNEFETKYSKLGAVINLDNHNQPGSHWVSLFADLDNYRLYYFDSVGKKPNKKVNNFVKKILTHMHNKKYNEKFNLEQFMKKFHKANDYDVRFNRIQHQFKNTECGVYSMNFIIKLLEGNSFDDIVNNITYDDTMNKNRLKYFN